MTQPLFDASILPVRHARAEALGGDYFLHERAFDECLDRIATVRRSFASACLLGTVRPGWLERLSSSDTRQSAFVGLAGDFPGFNPELCLSIGALDTAEELPALLTTVRHMLAPEGLFAGAFAGGRSLPKLRSAMATADQIDGSARPHFHPLIDPASFGSLLASAGFIDAVVDVDRVSLAYSSLDALVSDLRGMGATNRLVQRSRRPVSRRAIAAAQENFIAGRSADNTKETIEIIYFAAWAPAQSSHHQG